MYFVSNEARKRFPIIIGIIYVMMWQEIGVNGMSSPPQKRAGINILRQYYVVRDIGRKHVRIDIVKNLDSLSIDIWVIQSIIYTIHDEKATGSEEIYRWIARNTPEGRKCSTKRVIENNVSILIYFDSKYSKNREN